MSKCRGFSVCEDFGLLVADLVEREHHQQHKGLCPAAGHQPSCLVSGSGVDSSGLNTYNGMQGSWGIALDLIPKRLPRPLLLQPAPRRTAVTRSRNVTPATVPVSSRLSLNWDDLASGPGAEPSGVANHLNFSNIRRV